MEFTAKEKRAIDKAWDQLVYIASHSWGASHDLGQALKHEKASRGLTRAKAILVRAAVEGANGFRNGSEAVASELFGYSRGCLYAQLLGADVARRVSSYSTSADYGLRFIHSVSNLMALAAEAEAAAEGFRDRALAEASAQLRQAIGAA